MPNTVQYSTVRRCDLHKQSKIVYSILKMNQKTAVVSHIFEETVTFYFSRLLNLPTLHGISEHTWNVRESLNC